MQIPVKPLIWFQLFGRWLEMSNFQSSTSELTWVDQWSAARGSLAVAFLQWVACCTWSIQMQTPVKPLIWSKLEKRELQKKVQSMSIICQMTWNVQFSTFNLQWSGSQLILSALCQPCTLLPPVPLQQNLHRGFKLGLCWVCQFIKQKQRLIQKRQFLFQFQQVLCCQFETTMWTLGNQPQCNTYMVGVVKTEQGPWR